MSAQVRVKVLEQHLKNLGQKELQDILLPEVRDMLNKELKAIDSEIDQIKKQASLLKPHRLKEKEKLKKKAQIKERMRSIIKTSLQDIDSTISIITSIEKLSFIFGAMSAVYLATRAALNIYRSVFSKASHFCKNYHGSQKEKCILKFRLNALEKARQQLSRAYKACIKEEDRQKCRNKIHGKIIKYDQRIEAVKKELRSLK